jgi:hypothetical protein
MKYQVEVGSNLYQAGYTEDGEAYIAECYYVAIQFADGSRFEHQVTFPGAQYSEDEDGFGYEDIREVAKAKAERLAQSVRQSDAINFDYWVEVDPAYGSDAYQHQGIELQRAFADRFDR